MVIEYKCPGKTVWIGQYANGNNEQREHFLPFTHFFNLHSPERSTSRHTLTTPETGPLVSAWYTLSRWKTTSCMINLYPYHLRIPWPSSCFFSQRLMYKPLTTRKPTRIVNLITRNTLCYKLTKSLKKATIYTIGNILYAFGNRYILLDASKYLFKQTGHVFHETTW